jgi:hypothetical protein
MEELVQEREDLKAKIAEQRSKNEILKKEMEADYQDYSLKVERANR